jgi:hypothetical protein
MDRDTLTGIVGAVILVGAMAGVFYYESVNAPPVVNGGTNTGTGNNTTTNGTGGGGGQQTLPNENGSGTITCGTPTGTAGNFPITVKTGYTKVTVSFTANPNAAAVTGFSATLTNSTGGAGTSSAVGTGITLTGTSGLWNLNASCNGVQSNVAISWVISQR